MDKLWKFPSGESYCGPSLMAVEFIVSRESLRLTKAHTQAKVPPWSATGVHYSVCENRKGVALKPNSALRSPPTPLKENTIPFKLFRLFPCQRMTPPFVFLKNEMPSGAFIDDNE